VQRVSRAEVRIAGEAVGSIGEGLMVLVGVQRGDGPEDAKALANKLAGLRIFSDDEGKMNRSIDEIDGSVLVVSQFTLLGEVRKGRRPSFVHAAEPELAEGLVEMVMNSLSAAGLTVAGGQFGAKMEVELINDGPVTVLVETMDGRIL
jgi:D-tyrosyl-tRNA(Tyr) deacylase